MPIQDHFPLPASAQDLPLAEDPAAQFYLCFISSTDPATKQSWCPDVRAALPHLKAVFEGENAAQLAYVHVGQRPEWKDLDNVHRKKWNINAVPTLVRFQRVDGRIRETGRLVEGELLVERKLTSLTSGQS
ncbi:hypothetical protein ACN47E_008126 [Coniothyrium glycines]